MKCISAGITLLSILFVGSQGLSQGTVTSASVGFGSYSGQRDPNLNNRSCGLNVSANLGLNHTGVFSATGYQLQLSLDANFGGIGTGITLINPANNASANIVQTASGAGSAWQTSYFLYDTGGDRLIVFNQAAGNDVGSQWGYSNVISNLTETGWNPLWSDHYHPTYSKTGFANQVGTSPCNNTGFHFDDGREAIVATPIETSFGNVTHVTNTFQLKSNENQYWGFEGVDQALYLNGVVAVQSNLRVVLVGQSGWVEGPINPVGNFTVSHGSGSCSSSGCSWEIYGGLRYMLLAYTIGGYQYNVIIINPTGNPTVLSNSTPYCTSSSNPAICGAVQVHNFLTSNQPVSIPSGQIRNYQLEYYIGTYSQLNALGFNVFNGATVGNYTPGRAVTCTPNISAASNNQYPGDPVSNLVTNAGFYSSNPFSSSINNNGTYAAIAASTSGVGHIQLVPRTLSGTPLAFPSVYDLYTATSDGSQLVGLGVFNQQPDGSGIVDVPLGYKLNSNYLSLVPVTLGKDNFSNYYLQMLKFQVCN